MRILIVDDEDRLRTTLASFIALEGWRTAEASNGLAAQKLLRESHFDAVALDMRMPGLDGPGLLKWLMTEGPSVPVVMMSAFGEVSDAVDALKAGASDYLVKPFDPEELVMRLKNAAAMGRRPEAGQNSASGRETGVGGSVLSVDPAMKDIVDILDRAAPSDATILITGESGTGKEVAARFVHARSQRGGGPFVPVNLGGLPENLVESELFGYEKGAFTGADSRKVGLFETAAGGTLFLDEIGDMPAALQVKLLRAIQERKIQRLAGLGEIPIDVRIITATNRNLEDEVAAGRFREDLFYRINVIRAELLPLRKRPLDIPHLANLFLGRLASRNRPEITGFSTAALEALGAYGFPGNVRELENMVERALILSEGPLLRPRDFVLPVPDGGSEKPTFDSVPRGTLKQMEALMIHEALLRNEGHREKTALELGITRKTLRTKMNEYDIQWNGK